MENRASREEEAGLVKKIERYEALEVLKKRLLDEPEHGRLISLVAEAAALLIRAETVAVPMLSPDNLEVRYDHAYGKHAGVFSNMVIPIESAGLCGWVLENRRPILTNELLDDPRVKRELATALNITCATLAPLVARGRIIGGISAFNKSDGSDFTEDDTDDLCRFADYAAVLIDNARLMKELSRERDKLDSILDGVRDGIVFISKHGKVLKANRSIEDFIPVSAADMTGMNVRELSALLSNDTLFGWEMTAAPGKRCRDVVGCRDERCPAYSRGRIRCWTDTSDHFIGHAGEHGRGLCADICACCPVLSIAADALAVQREVKILGKTIQVSSSPIIHKESSEVSGEVMVFHDVTSRKLMERQRTEFVSMLTHDLKAPLTAIMGYCGLIAEEEDFDAVRRMNKAQASCSDQLLKMINDFLDLSKVEAGVMKLYLTPVQPSTFLKNLRETFTPVALERGVSFNCYAAEGTLDIHADAAQLSRIIGNLVSNSLKFVKRGGKVSVEVRNADRRGFVEIAVADDGPGISPDILDRIFDRYFTAGPRNEPGSGLGLAVVKEITEAHGGSVVVESREGVGTVFIVRLPAAVKEV